MIPILISSNDFSSVEIIVNKILYPISDVHVVYITRNVSNIREDVKRINPEIIITTNLKSIKSLKSNTVPIIQKIIFLTKDDTQIINSKEIHTIDINLPVETISSDIENFIGQNLFTPRKQRISQILKEFGYDFSLSGTSFLIDAISYISTYKCSYQNMFEYVAKKNNTTSKRVYWSIVRATNKMFSKHTKESYNVIEKYLKVYYPEKPYPKTVIGYIANEIKNEF